MSPQTWQNTMTYKQTQTGLRKLDDSKNGTQNKQPWISTTTDHWLVILTSAFPPSTKHDRIVSAESFPRENIFGLSRSNLGYGAEFPHGFVLKQANTHFDVYHLYHGDTMDSPSAKVINIKDHNWLVVDLPLWKNMISSVEMMKVPIYGKSFKIPWFQTTNQITVENFPFLPRESNKPTDQWTGGSWWSHLCWRCSNSFQT